MGALSSAHFGAAVLWDRSEETTSASLSFEKSGGQDKWFEHKSWDGPECKYQNHHEFSLRIPFGSLSLEISYDTEGAVRRRLPSSTDGLLSSLESKNRFELYGAADALAKKREVAALPHLLVAAERDVNVFDAIVLIAKSAPLQAVPLLTPALASTNSYLGLEVARLLGDLGSKATPAVPDLELAFKNAQFPG